jgi:hypothetical protein
MAECGDGENRFAVRGVAVVERGGEGVVDAGDAGLDGAGQRDGHGRDRTAAVEDAGGGGSMGSREREVMAEYRVVVEEVRRRTYLVEAESMQEAMRLYWDSEVEMVEDVGKMAKVLRVVTAEGQEVGL